MQKLVVSFIAASLAASLFVAWFVLSEQGNRYLGVFIAIDAMAVAVIATAGGLIGIRRNIANVRLAISSATSTAVAMSMLGTALAALLLMIYDALMLTASDRQLMVDLPMRVVLATLFAAKLFIGVVLQLVFLGRWSSTKQRSAQLSRQ
jgi:hypothetical protein